MKDGVFSMSGERFTERLEGLLENTGKENSAEYGTFNKTKCVVCLLFCPV